MSAEIKRLSKVARELNVGVSTLVEFLSDKGHEVGSNPNAKISPDQYNLLLEEFSSDISLKEKSKNVSIGTEKRETITLDEETAESKTPKKSDKEDEVLIKNIQNVEDEIVRPKVDKQEVKVVGKIDLSKKKKEEEKKEEVETEAKAEEKVEETKEEPKKEEAKSEETPKEKVEEKKEEKKSDEPYRSEVDKLNGPTIVGKIKLPEKEQKPVASSSEETDIEKPKKKKRRRIRKDPPTQGQGGGNSGPGRGRRPAPAKGKAEGGPSEEDIQKQIKETLARLSGGGKSKGAKYRRQKRDAVAQAREEELEKQEQDKSVLKVTEFVTVNELATMMSVSPTEVISACMTLGLFVSINQRLDAETLTIVAEEFGFSVEFVDVDDQELIKEVEDDPEDLIDRAPIVTVMGHVDHGKTSLLDFIRKANVIAGEAGGITQHIGAYAVELDSGKKISFLDTPGHEAFTAMRARGAQVTDIAIIVIACDDNVMPQTIEAINHAQAAGVPMVFALNKVDKPGANPDKIKEELSNMNLLVEDWGGKFQSQEISAKQGTGIDDLLEKVLLEAELLELKANPNKSAVGTIIESTLDKGRGYIATILVESGTLKVGDMVVAGSYYGKVKALHDERGKDMDEAGPSRPAVLLGLNGAPQAGDRFNVLEDEREAKNIAQKREQLQREQGIRTQKHITLDEIGRRLAIGDFQELNLIIKGDVDGSIEALSDSLMKLSTEKVQVNVIHKSVGQISESDVMLASASDAIIIGFQVRPSLNARKIAEKEQIDIRLYSVIYDAMEEVKAAMEGMLAPTVEEKIVCNLEIRDVFKITKVGTVAGCMVLDGKIQRKTNVRIIRDGIVVYTGKLGSLKRFKDDVKEVAKGYECGLNIENFNDIKEGDIIEGFEEVEVKSTL